MLLQMPGKERISRRGVFSFAKCYYRDTKEDKELKMFNGYHN